MLQFTIADPILSYLILIVNDFSVFEVEVWRNVYLPVYERSVYMISSKNVP